MGNHQQESWHSLARSRLRPPGVRGTDAMDWARRGSLALLLLAGVWFCIAAFRPLPTVDDAGSIAIPTIREIPGDGNDPVEIRREQLAKLGAGNIFDDERLMWRVRSAEAREAGVESDPAAKVAAASPNTTGMRIGDRDLRITKSESLPDDVKQALAGLALRGIFTPPVASGRPSEPVAMISKVFEGTNPLASGLYRAGDQFKDDKFPQAMWNVIAIDPEAKRVVLSRSNVNVVLELYPVVTLPPAVASIMGSGSEEKPARRVVLRTREEIALELLKAGISEEETARLLELVDLSPDEAAAKATLAEVIKSAEQTRHDEAENEKSKRAPPAGLEAIAKLLSEAPKQTAEEAPEGAGEAPPPAQNPSNRRRGPRNRPQ